MYNTMTLEECYRGLNKFFINTPTIITLGTVENLVRNNQLRKSSREDHDKRYSKAMYRIDTNSFIELAKERYCITDTGDLLPYYVSF